MKNAVVVGIAVALIVAFVSPGYAADASRPVVLLFDVNKGDGVGKEIAASATKALRNYFRDTQRVEVIMFDRESPVVLRAIMEKSLTPDAVASYASRDERLDVAKALDYPYAAGAEVAAKGNTVQVKLWLGKVDGGKKGRWETVGTATAIGSGGREIDNAMQSSASIAVIEIARLALMDLPRLTQPQASTGKESTAIGADQPPVVSQSAAPDYVAQADESLKSGNLALAIEQYARAVDTDPKNPSLRIKLAQAYARKGLYDQAFSELDRAATAGADKDAVAAARERIQQMQGGQDAAQVAPNASTPQDTPKESGNDVVVETPSASTGTATAVDKMREGDGFLRSGKADEAAVAYKEAIKLAPADWRAHERLTIAYSVMSMFTEGRKALEQLNAIQPDPPADIVSRRYSLLGKAFDNRFSSLLAHYDSDARDYEKKKTTRETYYNSTKALAMRLEAMAQFLDALKVPSAKEQANLHRSLACGLLAQAASSLLEYLESNNESGKSSATVFVQQARKEFNTATTLEGNKVVVAD